MKRMRSLRKMTMNQMRARNRSQNLKLSREIDRGHSASNSKSKRLNRHQKLRAVFQKLYYKPREISISDLLNQQNLTSPDVGEDEPTIMNSEL